MLISVLGFASVLLTSVMFLTRQAMLGFPCVIFWAILGGYCYQESVMTWDIYYFMFFACTFGMTIFCAFAAYGLREKRDSIADEEMEEDESGPIDKKEEKYIDEGSDVGKIDDLFSIEPDDNKPSTRTEALRERAKSRRTGGKRKSEETW